MALAPFPTHFQNELLRKYVILFGTLFNNIYITRDSSTATKVQNFKVPVAYGPREKYLAMVKQKPESKVKAIQLPIMSFEISGMQPDPERRFLRKNVYRSGDVDSFEPAPWNISFTLNIMTKTDFDASKIVEQCLYYFNPDWTVAAQLIDGNERTWDITTVFNDVSHQDVYEGDFTQRRALTWQINFTMKAWLHGPVLDKKRIKFIRINTHLGDLNGSTIDESTTIQPGLTANGQPTTDITQTIPYQQIEMEDNWDFIVQFTDGE